MKYLMIHKLLWLLLVVFWTGIECIFVFADGFICFLWDLKIPKNLWSATHSADKPWENRWGGYVYKDKNVYQTIKRRYYKTFLKE